MLKDYIANTPSAYPLDVFPPLLRRAAEEVLANTKVPDALAAMEFLAAMSACAQSSYDYESATGAVRPVSLNTLLVAESGERKSAAHLIIAKPIYDADDAAMRRHRAELKEFEVSHSLWKTVEAGNRRQLQSLIARQKPHEEQLKKIEQHERNKPIKPRLRRIIRQNITQRAFLEALEGNGEAISCMNDEGEVVIKGGLFGFTGLMNKCWDGATMLSMDRSDGVSIIVSHPRVSVSLMVQHSVLKTLVESKGENLRGSGHWARYLVGWPASTQGSRYTDTLDQKWEYLPDFHKKMKEILDKNAERKASGQDDRIVLRFSDVAKKHLLHLINQTEDLIGPLGESKDIRDAASKAVDMMGRIAALFHIFSHEEGEISVSTLDRAVKIYNWHNIEFKYLFSESSNANVEQDALKLEDYLLRKVWNMGGYHEKKNYVRNHGPIRCRERLDAALNMLDSHGVTWISRSSRGKGTSYINLNPSHFPKRRGLIAD